MISHAKSGPLRARKFGGTGIALFLLFGSIIVTSQTQTASADSNTGCVEYVWRFGTQGAYQAVLSSADSTYYRDIWTSSWTWNANDTDPCNYARSGYRAEASVLVYYQALGTPVQCGSAAAYDDGLPAVGYGYAPASCSFYIWGGNGCCQLMRHGHRVWMAGTGANGENDFTDLAV